MPPRERLTTTLSTKGRIVLPAPLRRALGWKPGKRLEVEATPGGVLLRPARLFPPTRYEDVFGSVPVLGGPRSIEEMDEAVLAEAHAQHERA